MRPKLLKGKTIGVVGAGHIGGSIIKRLSAYRPILHLTAYDHNARLRLAVSRSAEWRPSLVGIAADADILILCMQVPAIIAALGELGRVRRSTRPLVMDTGSTKKAIMKEAGRHRRLYDFIGLHPLAGTEKQGWAGAKASLFDGRSIIHCPRQGAGVALAKELTALLGARPIAMDATTHDRLAATAIGLPHLLAFAAQGMKAGRANPLRAGSWGSLTRVAGSDPAMVAGLLSSNPVELRRALREFERELAVLEKLIRPEATAQLTAALHRRRRRDT